MNERIKELNLQAMSIVMNGNDPDGDIEQMYIPSEFTKKFAELIVKECAGIGDNYQDILGNEPECFNCRKVAYGIVDKIKQHFGVEE